MTKYTDMDLNVFRLEYKKMHPMARYIMKQALDDTFNNTLDLELKENVLLVLDVVDEIEDEEKK